MSENRYWHDDATPEWAIIATNNSIYATMPPFIEPEASYV
jgi:hypothetical protein